MSKIATLFAALVLSAASTLSHASVIQYTTNAYTNSTGGGTGADSTTGAVHVNTGDVLDFNTDPTQMWAGAVPRDGNYGALHTNASGSTSPVWQIDLNETGVLVGFGSLVAEINNDFRFVGAGEARLIAWDSGDLHLWYLDSNNYDNSGSVDTTLRINASDVPEPASLAVMGLGLGLVSLVRSRRRPS